MILLACDSSKWPQHITYTVQPEDSESVHDLVDQLITSYYATNPNCVSITAEICFSDEDEIAEIIYIKRCPSKQGVFRIEHTEPYSATSQVWYTGPSIDTLAIGLNALNLVDTI